MTRIDPTKLNLIVRANDVKIPIFFILSGLTAILGLVYVLDNQNNHPWITVNSDVLNLYFQFPSPIIPKPIQLMNFAKFVLLFYFLSWVWDNNCFVVFRKDSWWQQIYVDNEAILVPAARFNVFGNDTLIRIPQGRNQYTISLPYSGHTLNFEIEINKIADRQSALKVLQWIEGFQHELKENRLDAITEARIENKLKYVENDPSLPIKFKFLNQL